MSGRGTADIVGASYDEGMRGEVPERDLNVAAAALPFVRAKFSSYAAYGQASVKDICGDNLSKLHVVTVNTLATMIFFNRGDHFEAKELPAEAQWSPAFAACVGDYDGDGHEDIFLSQNCFGMTSDTSRLDAGRGLWLNGDGHGNFRAVPGQESGIKVYGEQRGAALCDYDADGRVDMVVTQNGAETKLYHNVGARPGLRIRLKGPPGNPNGLGKQLRLIGGQRLSPTREVHAGSGYWSQDSTVQVLGAQTGPLKLWVRWPGGRTNQVDVPEAVKDCSVDIQGRIVAKQ